MANSSATRVGVEGVTLDGLEATSGSADYIAMREALVNLFIHQDYADPSTVAQIEIRLERATFFNAGRSLVSDEALLTGGASQARNPLISRALKLIGFAELAGSGLREIHRAWRKERRRPPRAISDARANTFTLILDWRPLPDLTDAFWSRHVGVGLTLSQTRALTLAAQEGGAGREELVSALGVLPDEADAIIDHLLLQALVDRQGDRIAIKAHLREAAERAGAG